MKLLIHGGVTTIGGEPQVREALEAVLQQGYAHLRAGASALEAVQEAVVLLEDCPLFNAGRGSALTCEGHVEMDAAIMCGKARSAGAVACVSRIKNPIRAARAVMEKSPHVLLVGGGAEKFAGAEGCETAPNDWFMVPERVAQWRALQNAEATRPSTPSGSPGAGGRFGTVGAVALDRAGNVAAATSTGGTMNKRPGRVGDSPLIGSGTYADNNSVAVSITGTGEYIIRTVAAHSLASLVAVGGLSLQAAAGRVLEDLILMGGSAGLIAIDRRGDIVLSFNTEAMLRGYVGEDGRPHVGPVSGG